MQLKGPASVLAGGKVQFSVSGGIPPYHFQLLEGAGSVAEDSGVFLAPDFETVVLISVNDSAGGHAEAKISITPQHVDPGLPVEGDGMLQFLGPDNECALNDLAFRGVNYRVSNHSQKDSLDLICEMKLKNPRIGGMKAIPIHFGGSIVKGFCEESPEAACPAIMLQGFQALSQVLPTAQSRYEQLPDPDQVVSFFTMHKVLGTVERPVVTTVTTQRSGSVNGAEVFCRKTSSSTSISTPRSVSQSVAQYRCFQASLVGKVAQQEYQANANSASGVKVGNVSYNETKNWDGSELCRFNTVNGSYACFQGL
jgi:hypothetical protein